MSFLPPRPKVFWTVFSKILRTRADPVSGNVIAFAYIMGAVVANVVMRSAVHEIISVQNVPIRLTLRVISDYRVVGETLRLTL